MIEDMPDKEVQQVGKTLPEGANTLLLMEDEYKNTHQEGRNHPLHNKITTRKRL